MIYKNVELYNVEEVKVNDGLILSRIPEKIRKNLNENAKNAALHTTGCEIRFNMKTEKGKIILEGNGKGICEVYFGDFWGGWYLIENKPTEIEIRYPTNIENLKKLSEEKKLRFDPYVVRVILPHLLMTKIIEIKGDFEPPNEKQIPKRKYLAYGSSITHGAISIRPTGTYVSKTSQILGVDLINLGFGGGAHLEKEIVDYIVNRNDWDFATFELGINMVGSFEVEEFEKRVDYFVDTLANKKKENKLFFIDIFPFYLDFENAEKQKKFRDVVAEKVKKLNRKNIYHISGFEILKSVEGLSYDILHPSPYGMEEMGYNLASILKKYGI